MARRTKNDTGERRTATVTLQLTPTERATLDERAEAAGVPMSDYARAALFGYRVQIKDPVKDRALFELSAIGNNLNQLAHRANATGEIDTEELTRALGLWRGVVERLHE